MKKILVTGGAGFIGSTLVDALVKKNFDVVVIDNLITGRSEYLNPKAKFIQLDICDKSLEKIFQEEQFDLVFHLAAQIDVRVSVANPVFDAQTNLIGAINVLENARRFGVKKIVFSSSAAVYGEPDQIPTSEDFPAAPLSPYGVSKLAFEKYLQCYYLNFGLKYVALRFSNVFGPRQFKGGEAGVVSIFIDNAVNGKKSCVFGDGSKKRDFIFVEDIVEALILAGESDFCGVLNTSSGNEHSVKEVLEAVKNAMNDEILVEYCDEKAGDPDRSVLDNKKIKDQLGWQNKVSLQDGILMTIDWSKKNLNKK